MTRRGPASNISTTLLLTAATKTSRPAASTHRNIQTHHRLKYGYWKDGATGAATTADDLEDAQELYWSVIRQCPPLPDCVFAYKRLKKARNEGITSDDTPAEPPPKRGKTAGVAPREIIDLTDC